MECRGAFVGRGHVEGCGMTVERRLYLRSTIPLSSTTMASQWKGKGKQEQVIESPLKVTKWREVSLEGSAMILSVVKEAARLAPIPELKRAASTALLILRTIQVWTRKNNGTYYCPLWLKD